MSDANLRRFISRALISNGKTCIGCRRSEAWSSARSPLLHKQKGFHSQNFTHFSHTTGKVNTQRDGAVLFIAPSAPRFLHARIIKYKKINNLKKKIQALRILCGTSQEVCHKDPKKTQQKTSFEEFEGYCLKRNTNARFHGAMQPDELPLGRRRTEKSCYAHA